jgi:hypothetical protein
VVVKGKKGVKLKKQATSAKKAALKVINAPCADVWVDNCVWVFKSVFACAFVCLYTRLTATRSFGRAHSLLQRTVSVEGQEDLLGRLIPVMEKHRDTFFVVQLRTPPHLAANPIRDLDPCFGCDLVDSRDQFQW